MVKLSAIRDGNAALRDEKLRDVVAVFVGATSGIGLSTLEKTVTLFPNPTIHVLGRSETKFASQRSKVGSVSPEANVIFHQCDVTLLADVDKICEAIANAETKIDYLFMSPGLIPINGPQYTKEGLEICFVLSYYARIRLIQNLLPLLQRSPDPRVLSVLNAGHEQPLVEDDMGLGKGWTTMTVINQATTMMSLALQHLAQAHQDITFLHSYPGLVQTDIFFRLQDQPTGNILWKLVVLLISTGVTALMWLRGLSAEESGEWQSWNLTSKSFEKGRLHQINEHGDEYAGCGSKAFQDYKSDGWPEKVWEHTERTIDKATTMGHV